MKIIDITFSCLYLLLIGWMIGLGMAMAEPALPYQAEQPVAPRFRGATDEASQGIRERIARVEEGVRTHEAVLAGRGVTIDTMDEIRTRRVPTTS